MPLTNQERRFLGHYWDETCHFELGHDSCVRQLRERGIDHHDLLPFLKVHREERRAGFGEPLSLEYISIAQMPDAPTPCPWAGVEALRKRVVAATRLSEANAHLSRDFQYARRYGFFNRAPEPPEEFVIYAGKEPQAPQGWVYRGRFPGIKRGHVEESLRRFAVSVWDPTDQPSLAVRCEYLLLVETKPRPLRIWGVTRSDILWFTADEKVYKAVFPTPQSP